MLAERYQWTPQEIDALAPDFIEELSAYIAAEAVIKHKHRTKPKRTRNA